MNLIDTLNADNRGDDKSQKDLSRRGFIKNTLKGTSALALTLSASTLIHNNEAWGMEAKGLSPDELRNLIQMARDIYPHDRFPDRIYAEAIKGHDEAAAKDEKTKAMLSDGLAKLNAAAKSKYSTDQYADMGWEEDRVEILKAMESDPFFQTIRGGLVVSVYNNPKVWEILGYEGASFDKGGYLNRGFNDIDWL